MAAFRQQGRIGRLRFLKSPARRYPPPSPPAIAQQRAPQVTNAPRGLIQNCVDAIPNLLITTLAVVSLSLPPGSQVHASAPQANKNTTVDQPPNIVLTKSPQPQGDQWFISAPAIKPQIQCDVVQNFAVLQVAPIIYEPRTALIINGQPKYQTQVDQQPNVLPLGSVVAQPPGDQQFASAPQVKGQPTIDQLPSIVAALGPLPIGHRLVLSAPQAKSAVYSFDSINVLPLSLPIGHRLVLSAPQTRAIGIDQPANRLPLLTAIAPFIPVDLSQFQPKYSVSPNLYPARPFVAPAGNPIPLPLGLPVDVSQFQPKYNVIPSLYPARPYVAASSTPIPLPLGLPVDTNGAKLKFSVTDYQQPNTLIGGIPVSLMPGWADFEVPQAKAQTVAVFQPLNILTLGIPVPVVSTNEPRAVLTFELAPKYQLTDYQQRNTLIGGIPLNLMPGWQDDQAPVSFLKVPAAEQQANRLPLFVIPAPPFKPVDVSRLQTKYQVIADAQRSPLNLGIPVPVLIPLPLSAIHWTESAPIIRPETLYGIPPIYPLTLGISTAPSTGLTMPNLVGLLIWEAINVLIQNGNIIPIGSPSPLALGYFTPYPVSAIWPISTKPVNTVIAQSIPFGASVVPNAKITLTVSRPPFATTFP